MKETEPADAKKVTTLEEQKAKKEFEKAMKEAAARAIEGQIVAMRHTPDGAIPLRQIKGEKVDTPIPEVELEEEVKLSTQEEDMMNVIFTAVGDIKKLKNRSIPLTRSELLNPSNKGGCTDLGFQKGVLKNLVKKGLLDSVEVDLLRADGKSVGRRGLVYFTPKGRAYVRKYIDEKYQPLWLSEGSSRDGDDAVRESGTERIEDSNK